VIYRFQEELEGIDLEPVNEKEVDEDAVSSHESDGEGWPE